MVNILSSFISTWWITKAIQNYTFEYTQKIFLYCITIILSIGVDYRELLAQMIIDVLNILPTQIKSTCICSVYSGM